MSGRDPLLETLADPPAESRPIPFWSWNDKLDPERLSEQARAMAERGIGGFFMHARGGLETEYLGEDWMRCVEAEVASAKELGLRPWAYDEEGWPSGFAGGRVPAKGEAYQGLWISLEAAGGELLGDYGDCAVYLHRNPNYIDVLSAEAVAAFIEETHERYRARLGSSFSSLAGFFTDEPRLSGSIDRDMPWSLRLPERFRAEYGYDLLEKLPALFRPLPGHEALRYDFWKLVSKLFVSSFMAQIHDWCSRSGLELTGHVMMEESVYVQMANTGGVMPFYEHMDMPGVDWLRRGIGSPIVPKQVGSVAAQLGKKRVITESFALCGWDASLEELRWIAHWQFVNGVNMLCGHLSAYSLRGFRKRDYPPSLFHQQTWWDEYGLFNDYIARLGLFLSEGRSAARVLLLHPIRSGWVMYDGLGYDERMRELDASFVRAAEWLSGGHVEYHLGDETIIEGHGSVDSPRPASGGRGAPAFVVGGCRYEAVVLPPMRCLGSATLELLLAFARAGGSIVALGELPSLVDGRPDARLAELAAAARRVDIARSSPREALAAVASASPGVADAAGRELSTIHLAVRDCGDRKLIFLANLDKEGGYRARVSLPWRGAVSRCELSACSLEPAGAEPSAGGSSLELELPAMGAACLVVDTAALGDASAAPASAAPASAAARVSPLATAPEALLRPGLDWDWEISSCDPNALSLDLCEYRIDGGPWLGPKSVIAIQSELLGLRRPCEISLRFSFESEIELSGRPLFLVLERPGDFRISLNGEAVPVVDRGSWKDDSFRKIDVAPFARRGRNELVLERRFYQSRRVYEVLFGEGVYETEKNKLTYDVELESAYLIGDFGVESRSAFVPGERNSIHTDGPFVMTERVRRITGGDLSSRGFPFFSGRMTLARDLGPREALLRSAGAAATAAAAATGREGAGPRLVLELGRPRAPLVEVRLNGRRAALLAWAPFRADLTELLEEGGNRLEITLYSSNRNLLGPHHHVAGESYKVGPDSFTGRWSWVEKETEAFPASAEDRARNYWRDGYSFVTFGLL